MDGIGQRKDTATTVRRKATLRILCSTRWRRGSPIMARNQAREASPRSEVDYRSVGIENQRGKLCGIEEMARPDITGRSRPIQTKMLIPF